MLRAWLLRACLRAAVGRGLVWVRGRRRSCAAVSPGEFLLAHAGGFFSFISVTGLCLLFGSRTEEARLHRAPVAHPASSGYRCAWSAASALPTTPCAIGSSLGAIGSSVASAIHHLRLRQARHPRHRRHPRLQPRWSAVTASTKATAGPTARAAHPRHPTRTPPRRRAGTRRSSQPSRWHCYFRVSWTRAMAAGWCRTL